ncbi:protein unc-13 homolog C-like [Exaiptasia diaphana]|uniref:Unc-13-like C n=1 Tax=Exaiptasia diaphana TaxID=2652724 RepID=A0A913YY64_EXADI|nr:protein unc-13 homolog C-like [Exaiptasia diaphana]
MPPKNKRLASELDFSKTSTPMKPSSKQSKFQDEEEEISLKSMYKMLQDMNKKLEKLGDIERHLARVDQDIKDLKKSCEYAHESYEELKKEQEEEGKAIRKLEERIDKIEEENKKLKDDTIDLRARSMRNNLLFYNIPEEEDEARNSKSLIEGVIEDIGLDVSLIEIDRAHRIGKKTSGKPRPIVSKFLRYQDREEVRRNAYKLKGSKVGIAEQFPKEIAEKRKELYPIYKKAKSEGKKARMIKDQLYVEGQRYTAGPPRPGLWGNAIFP